MTEQEKDLLIVKYKEVIENHEKLDKVNNEIIHNLKKIIVIQSELIKELREIFNNLKLELEHNVPPVPPQHQL
jgi:hypothetical protein